jgi:hypothetical protein
MTNLECKATNLIYSLFVEADKIGRDKIFKKIVKIGPPAIHALQVLLQSSLPSDNVREYARLAIRLIQEKESSKFLQHAYTGRHE